ncbi:hypothetical protein Q1695_000183 [Nippostrongylus brasiliensis]|nr:hypothetical protein Q1695_000183 [Nippostrongylus brasiliensis]
MQIENVHCKESQLCGFISTTHLYEVLNPNIVFSFSRAEMAAFSYDTREGVPYDNDYLICFGLFYVTSAAKFFACYFFVVCLLVSGLNFLSFGFDHTWFSLFCVLFTAYSIATVYGVFLEKRLFLLPFICIQTIATVVLSIGAVTLAVLGIATNAIQRHHEESQALRELYAQYNLDPDDEITQTMAAWSVLVVFLLLLAVTCFSLWVVYKTYQIYALRDRASRAGYCHGVPTTERL